MIAVRSPALVVFPMGSIVLFCYVPVAEQANSAIALIPMAENTGFSSIRQGVSICAICVAVSTAD